VAIDATTGYTPTTTSVATRAPKPATTGGEIGGGSPAPTPSTYLNRGWCETHSAVEYWETSGAPGPAPGGHTITAGSTSYTILT